MTAFNVGLTVTYSTVRWATTEQVERRQLLLIKIYVTIIDVPSYSCVSSLYKRCLSPKVYYHCQAAAPTAASAKASVNGSRNRASRHFNNLHFISNKAKKITFFTDMLQYSYPAVKADIRGVTWLFYFHNLSFMSVPAFYLRHPPKQTSPWRQRRKVTSDIFKTWWSWNRI